MKQLRTIRGLMFLTTVVALYVHMGVGGYRAHRQELASHAERWYQVYAEHEAEEALWAERVGISPPKSTLYPDGPRHGIDFCVPLLPGVLLVDSWSGVGPLYAGGGWKIVLFHGVGSFTLCEIVGWLA